MLSSVEKHEADVAEAAQRLARRIRELRQQHGWSLAELADVSGVSRSMLSQIERNEASPTFNVAYRIAKAFGMSLGELVQAPDEPAGIEVIRADDESYHFRKDDTCSVRTLFPLRLEKDVEFYEVKLRPGHALRSEPHLEGTREFLTVHKGRIQIQSGGHSAVLGPGDSGHYRADVPHAIENVGRGDAVAFLVAVYRR
ncbi:MAG: helix-turn-helix domain-containing protein [Planctomycetes bacterium]|nr:helix-turn-helix domain-containing protein [Planctomycetota bacterium]